MAALEKWFPWWNIISVRFVSEAKYDTVNMQKFVFVAMSAQTYWQFSIFLHNHKIKIYARVTQTSTSVSCFESTPDRHWMTNQAVTVFILVLYLLFFFNM